MGEALIDTLVVGAGPYGLSVAAHLKRAGVPHRLHGRTMEAWSAMPSGMCLRSPVEASSLCDPDRELTLEAFHRETGRTLGPPIPLDSFLSYGHWFAERAGLESDPRLVSELRFGDGGFEAVLDDGEQLRARRVVLAAGTGVFQWTPPEFRGLPGNLVSHSGDHTSFSKFAGKKVLVIGAGQSGIECAALAHEHGAIVTVLVRRPLVRWLSRSARLHQSRVLRPLLYSWSDVGPAGLSQVVSAPGLFRMVPSSPRNRATLRCARPAAASWLIERTSNVSILTGRQIREITAAAERVQLECQDGERFEADHLLLATGYKVDLSHYAFLAPELRAAIRTAHNSPVLGRALTSSVPGLHILGLPSAWSFGPLMRHVAGAHFAARSVTACLAATRSHRRRLTRADVEPARAG